MIEVYSGIPGAGKTYWIVDEAVKLMKKGFNVYSNFPIVHGKYSSYVIKEDDLKTYRFEDNSYLIIDEAQRWFESRNWKDFQSGLSDMFSQHRHMGVNMILATQHPKRLDTIIRDCVTLFWKFRKILSIYYPILVKDKGKLKIGLKEQPILFSKTGYYEFEDYGQPVKVTKIYEPAFDFVKKHMFASFVAQNSYNTRYYKSIFAARPLISNISWKTILN
jgi:hypothetical protein